MIGININDIDNDYEIIDGVFFIGDAMEQIMDNWYDYLIERTILGETLLRLALKQFARVDRKIIA